MNSDIDECLYDNGGCAQTCSNFEGGHVCLCEISCRPGYVMQGSKCVGKSLTVSIFHDVFTRLATDIFNFNLFEF